MRTSQGSGCGRNAQNERHVQANLHDLVSILIQGHEGEHEKAVFKLETTISGALIH